MASKFSLGQVYTAPGVVRELKRARVSAFAVLERHRSGDWGEMDPEDCQKNEEALEGGGWLHSAYTLPTGATVWVKTEASRTLTVVALPEEF